MDKIKPGDKAPDFILFDQNLNRFKLSDCFNKKPVVLFFYPKDETKTCTKEVCCFRDKYQDFINIGADVIGISSDSIESHQQFSEKHNLPFRILSDPNGIVKNTYGISKVLGLIPGRETFIINKQGIVIKIYRDAFHGEFHVEKALEALD
ncbi:MAG: peroxiredoxin [Bacteroidetes bacterium]|nr:peroxiredoxin [Bacteroidota bacterium]HET6246034.1 peroxiredoxin [Bacteroidia bacterium]